MGKTYTQSIAVPEKESQASSIVYTYCSRQSNSFPRATLKFFAFFHL